MIKHKEIVFEYETNQRGFGQRVDLSFKKL
jgi:hypothetical protein